jgi:uroporphyrinogen-III synthase
MAFDDLRVLSLESRRSVEIEKLIRARGGQPTVAQSMREVPLADNPKVFAFAERLFRGEFDMMILLTGVGTRLMSQVIETRWPAGSFANALKQITVVARGSKPIAVLREWNVPVTVAVPEPNTWREILASIDGRSEKQIAVQEYGRPSGELVEGLRARGAEVTEVPVYQWDLPENREPLNDAVRRLARGEFDVVMFTTSIQVNHLFRVAEELESVGAVRDALGNMMIASVGPTTSETLAEFGLRADLEPSHPKMGFLVNETAAAAAHILEQKRGKL